MKVSWSVALCLRRLTMPGLTLRVRWRWWGHLWPGQDDQCHRHLQGHCFKGEQSLTDTITFSWWYNGITIWPLWKQKPAVYLMRLKRKWKVGLPRQIYMTSHCPGVTKNPLRKSLGRWRLWGRVTAAGARAPYQGWIEWPPLQVWNLPRCGLGVSWLWWNLPSLIQS